MLNVRPQLFFRLPVLGFALVIGVSAVVPGCGETPPSATVTAEDAAATQQRNNAMEDYMKSSAGKKATRPAK